MPTPPEEHNGYPEADPYEPTPEALAADYRLAKRCAAGEVAAWERLFSEQNDRLLTCIESLLEDRIQDRNAIQDMATCVWHRLVENDGDLMLRYDSARGLRLAVFIQSVASDIVYHHFPWERPSALDRRGSTRRPLSRQIALILLLLGALLLAILLAPDSSAWLTLVFGVVAAVALILLAFWRKPPGTFHGTDAEPPGPDSSGSLVPRPDPSPFLSAAASRGKSPSS